MTLTENPTRIVVKLGTNILSTRKQWSQDVPRSTGKHQPEGHIDLAYLHRIADQITRLRSMGKQVIIVTSGAIGMGAGELGMDKRVKGVDLRQACAAIGQPLLMQEYRSALGIYGLTVAQILITREVLNNRTSYNNLRNSVETLLSLGVIPIFNENDTVSTDEIGSAFGDNDQLSALVASKIDAELLIILSDIDALYDSDPRSREDAKPLAYVQELTPEIFALAGEKGSEFSTGGMKTKLKAVEIARDAGCWVVITHGRTPDVLVQIAKGEPLGTRFAPTSPLKNRTRWLKNARPSGHITIDDGALEAIKKKKSLLAKGVVQVNGNFHGNTVVNVNGIAHLLCPFSSDELRQIMGKHSHEISGILGPGTKELIARPEDIVFLQGT